MILCYFKLYDVTFHNAIRCYISQRNTMLHYNTSRHITSYYIILHDIILFYIIRCCISQRNTMLHFTTQHDVTFHNATRCYITIHRVTSHHITLYCMILCYFNYVILKIPKSRWSYDVYVFYLFIVGWKWKIQTFDRQSAA
jgi:hypothetical protein